MGDDHPPHLSRGRADRAQERDLTPSLLDRQPDDRVQEDGHDDQRHAAEDARQENQLQPARGDAGLLGAAAIVAREHREVLALETVLDARFQRAEIDSWPAVDEHGVQRGPRHGVRDAVDRGDLRRQPGRGHLVHGSSQDEVAVLIGTGMELATAELDALSQADEAGTRARDRAPVGSCRRPRAAADQLDDQRRAHRFENDVDAPAAPVLARIGQPLLDRAVGRTADGERHYGTDVLAIVNGEARRTRLLHKRRDLVESGCGGSKPAPSSRSRRSPTT